jgi:hypothetical protein
MLFHRRRALPEPRNYTPSGGLPTRWHWNRDIRKSSTYKLLQRIEAASLQIQEETAGDIGKRAWLLPFRRELRRLLAGFDSRYDKAEIDVVRCYLLTCPQTMIAICVWLLGEFADRRHLYELKTFRQDPSPPIRRHVAKALRRLEAWSYLREMAAANRDDARIQWFAIAPPTHAPFATRLENYKRCVDDSRAGDVATPSRMPFWAGVRYWERTPPKSVAYIRRMLRRIQFWVHSGTSR